MFFSNIIWLSILGSIVSAFMKYFRTRLTLDLVGPFLGIIRKSFCRTAKA